MKKAALLVLVAGTIFVLSTQVSNRFNKNNQSEHVQGIILPHHNLVTDLFQKSFIKLEQEVNPEIIVILGTNHLFPSSQTFTTTHDSRERFNLYDLYENDDRIQNEHSIQTLLPYIKQHFPNIEVVPIIISGSYSPNKLNEEISKIVNAFKDKNVLYIAAIDFAHEVTLEEGLSNNNESIQSISTFDYDKIINYKDDHLDSPVGMVTFLKIMESLNARKWELWQSTHGALETNTLSLKGTSYVVGVFKTVTDN